MIEDKRAPKTVKTADRVMVRIWRILWAIDHILRGNCISEEIYDEIFKRNEIISKEEFRKFDTIKGIFYIKSRLLRLIEFIKETPDEECDYEGELIDDPESGDISCPGCNKVIYIELNRFDPDISDKITGGSK